MVVDKQMSRPWKQSKLTYGNFINIRGGIIDYYKRINHSISDRLSTWKKIECLCKNIRQIKGQKTINKYLNVQKKIQVNNFYYFKEFLTRHQNPQVINIKIHKSEYIQNKNVSSSKDTIKEEQTPQNGRKYLKTILNGIKLDSII